MIATKYILTRRLSLSFSLSPLKMTVKMAHLHHNVKRSTLLIFVTRDKKLFERFCANLAPSSARRGTYNIYAWILIVHVLDSIQNLNERNGPFLYDTRILIFALFARPSDPLERW